MADQKIESVMEQPKSKMHDKLDEVRASAQKLHSSISSTLPKHRDRAIPDIEALKKQARQSAEQARSAMRERFEAAQEEIHRKLDEAAKKLEAAERHASDGLKSSGNEFREHLMYALAEARASARDVSEAIAAKRAQIASKQKPAKNG